MHQNIYAMHWNLLKIKLTNVVCIQGGVGQKISVHNLVTSEEPSPPVPAGIILFNLVFSNCLYDLLEY